MSEAEQRDSFVNVLWEQIDAAGTGSEIEIFVRKHPNTKRWLLTADFCFEPSRPNDAFAFVLLPVTNINAQAAALNELCPRDMKRVQQIELPFARFYRSGNILTLGYVADRDRKLFKSREVAISALDSLLEYAKSNRAPEWTERQVRLLRTEIEKNSTSLALFQNIILTAAFAGHVLGHVSRAHPSPAVLWAPDPDRITTAYSCACDFFTHLNTWAMARRLGVSPPAEFGVGKQSSPNLWLDPFIRLADYASGSLSAWDPPSAGPYPEKVGQFISKCVASNPLMHVHRLAVRGEEDGALVDVRKLRIRKQLSSTRTRYRPSKLARLRGLSHKLTIEH